MYIAPPDEAARQDILRLETRRMPLAGDVDLAELAALVTFVGNPSARTCSIEAPADLPRAGLARFGRIGAPPQTRGYSGAELAGVCREAALLAMEVDLNVAQVCEWR